MNRIILNETSYFGAGCRSVIAVEAASNLRFAVSNNKRTAGLILHTKPLAVDF